MQSHVKLPSLVLWRGLTMNCIAQNVEMHALGIAAWKQERCNNLILSCNIIRNWSYVHFYLMMVNIASLIVLHVVYRPTPVDKALIILHVYQAGQEAFRSVTRIYYRGASCALLVYDVTRRPTFENIESWMTDLKNNTTNPKPVLVLVGNKRYVLLCKI